MPWAGFLIMAVRGWGAVGRQVWVWISLAFEAA